jgi:hypothetical protein
MREIMENIGTTVPWPISKCILTFVWKYKSKKRDKPHDNVQGSLTKIGKSNTRKPGGRVTSGLTFTSFNAELQVWKMCVEVIMLICRHNVVGKRQTFSVSN